jgi:2-amino-4-hydroxy-6-hydroxymethyldihydropteridine diphosphokinase
MSAERMRSGQALIAIGANLPAGDGAPPLESCKAALAALDALPGLRVVAASRWWESAPIPPNPYAPRYVNGVASDPVLPHPRAHLRGFVLYPLAEVAPDWVHPRLKQPVAALIAALPAQDLRPIIPA